MLFNSKKFAVAISLVVALLSGFGAMQAFGDDDRHERGERGEKHEGRGHERGEGKRFTATNATFQAECSSCHIAYPPNLLPASSWREMMGTLDKHFDTDASLDAATIAEILPFLEQNAASERKSAAGKPVLRITETGWFKHEHDEISPAVWKRDAIKSASNCMACHTAADKGDFEEDNIRIPK
ncbi:MAG TPA: diheme cytochrome c [Candidatus Thiothrix moscowensis]|uniref:diheme cytochrome c n=1 Tax=unclassified Thiothrix TaxID=2636184 RepID=UPI0025D10B1A|nr:MULTISPECIES: diheme cytochrome c [unclassified Thiothrix]HRJ51588.1 diheme cytochrome c [Candidatus Thiothrix moscowensis]HRJ91903.1 diheme cytochrome c [Candidatus Thiothrix moscowensis]